MNPVSFSELNLTPEILRAVEEMGFQNATEIQSKSIPMIYDGQDVVGRSQTGTGKTAAFGIPAINIIDTAEDKRSIQVLLLCPTRELAVQACDEVRKLAKYTSSVKPVAVYGGAPIERQISQLRFANIVIGTPGRVMDHMRRRTLKLNNLKMIILDEADEMLSMGFREDIETILQETPEERQTILFSATMPPEIMKIIRNYQKDPQIVEVNRSQVTLDSISQFYYDVPMGRKNDALNLLLHFDNPARSIIFCNTKRMVDELTNYLNDSGFKAEGLHGDLKQSQRTTVMNAYKAGRTAILVATDVAARGIDVDDVECVVNFDIPQNYEYYVHRIGRTGRAGKSGVAYTICSGRRQVSQLMEIGRIVKAKIQPQPIPSVESILQKQKVKSQNKMEAVLEGKTIYPYMDMVESLKETHTAEEIAATALELLYSKDALNLPAVEGIVRKRMPGGRYTKLVIDVGREERMAPNYIVGAIADRTSLSGKDIGKIEIYDKKTTVEVPEDQVESVLEAMKGCRINGHKTTTVVLKPVDGESFGSSYSSGYKKLYRRDNGPRKPYGAGKPYGNKDNSRYNRAKPASGYVSRKNIAE